MTENNNQIEAIVDSSIENISELVTNVWHESYSRENRNRFIADIQLLQKYLTNKNDIYIGDLGAAPFVTSLAYKKMGYDIDSYDVAPERFKELEGLDLNLLKINLDNWGNPPHEKYNLLLLSEVFEHLRGNLIAIAESMHKSLKPGGILYLTTPNFRSVTGIYKYLFKRVSYAYSKDLYDEWNKINTIGHMGHVREYTFHELLIFFKKTGFEIEVAYTKPVILGTGVKNKILFLFERLFNPFKLGGATVLILKKSHK